MSLIFLSHSSVDELEAIALKQWLLDNGWDDVFLDLDPERGRPLRGGHIHHLPGLGKIKVVPD